MTNEEKINLIGQKMLILSNNFDKYQQELDSLKQQLLLLQQQQTANTTKPIAEPLRQESKPNIEPPPAIEPKEKPILQPPPAYIPPVQAPTASGSGFNFEEFIGGKLLTILGIIILVIGLGIGVKYAIDRDLITPLTRIILAYVAGIVLLLLALRLKSKYKVFSAVLLSGAMASLYFTTYAAYDLYTLFPQLAAFGMMVLFTLFTVYAAMMYDLQVIGAIGLVGAYAVPPLLSDGSGHIEYMLGYMAIVNVGILVLSFKRYWLVMHYLAFFMTWLILGTWFMAKFDPEKHTLLVMCYSFFFFISFYLSTMAYKLLKKEPFGVFDVISIVVNSFFYFGIGYACLNHGDTSLFLGLFTVLNALIHFIFSAAVFRTNVMDRKLFYLLFAMVMSFITIAVPVQLEGNWVTLLWSAEAFLLFYIGRAKAVKFYEYIGYILGVLATISLLEDWSESYYVSNWDDTAFLQWTPFFNINFLGSLITCFALGGMLYYQWKKPEGPFSGNLVDKIATVTLGLLLFLCSYSSISNEISASFTMLYQTSVIKVPSSTAWAEPGAVDTIYNYSWIRIKDVVLTMYGLLYFAVLLFIAGKKWNQVVVRWIAFGFASLMVLLFLTMGLEQLGQLRSAYLEPISAEYFPPSSYFNYLRYLSFILFALLLFSIDRLLKSQPFDRFTLGRVYRYCLLHFLILVVLSNELLNINILIHYSPEESTYQISKTAYKLGFTALWGIYSLAMIVYGIARKNQLLRITAFSLFGITILKLLLVDTWDLSTGYKVMAYILLGVILLIVAFLYQRFKNFLFSDDEPSK